MSNSNIVFLPACTQHCIRDLKYCSDEQKLIWQSIGAMAQVIIVHPFSDKALDLEKEKKILSEIWALIVDDYVRDGFVHKAYDELIIYAMKSTEGDMEFHIKEVPASYSIYCCALQDDILKVYLPSIPLRNVVNIRAKLKIIVAAETVRKCLFARKETGRFVFVAEGAIQESRDGRIHYSLENISYPVTRQMLAESFTLSEIPMFFGGQSGYDITVDNI